MEKVTKHTFIEQAAMDFLSDKLPFDWESMEDNEFLSLIKELAWEPFEDYDPCDLWELIESSADVRWSQWKLHTHQMRFTEQKPEECNDAYGAEETLNFIRDKEITWELFGSPKDGDGVIQFYHKSSKLAVYPWECKNCLMEGLAFLMDMEDRFKKQENAVL